jgi:hypothetical protein
MAKIKPQTSSEPRAKIRPALTPEARENQLISLAIDLVEQRLLDGTASSQETTHFLKLATNKAKLERERFELENELIKAKTQALRDQADMKTLYANAIAAMRRYGGHNSEFDEDEDDEYEDY